MSDLVANTIGIEDDLSEFLRAYPPGDVFAVDGVIEILRAPLPQGWKSSSVHVELVGKNEYPLDAGAIKLLSPYKEKLAGLGWETKYRVAGLDLTRNARPGLQVVFAPTTYEEGTGFHRTLLEAADEESEPVLLDRRRFINQILQLGKYSLPGIAVVHTIVITSDDYVVSCQRSPDAGYHRSRWSITFEEQINRKDLAFGNAALSAAAIRGFQEELASGHDMVLDDAYILGVFLEYNILNIGFCVLIRAPSSFDEVKYNWDTKAKDRWEAVRITKEPFTLDNIVKLLGSNDYGEEESRGSFHSTSKYRLLLAAIHHFGSDKVLDALKSL